MIKPPKDISNALDKAHQLTGVPIPILYAVAWTESRYNPQATSPVGAKGLMQIMPVNYEKYGITDPYDVTQSANAGAKILANLKRKYGQWDKALAAYNWGTGNVQRKPKREQWPKKTQAYVDEVLSLAGTNITPNNGVSINKHIATIAVFTTAIGVIFMIIKGGVKWHTT